MRRYARTVAAGIVVILGLALVSAAAVGGDGDSPIGRPSVPDDHEVQAVPPFNPKVGKDAGLPKSLRPGSFDSEFGQRGEHEVEVRITGGAVYAITWRNDPEPEWGVGSVQRSRTINSGFPVVQVGMDSRQGAQSTCVIIVDGEERDTQTTSEARPIQFCEA